MNETVELFVQKYGESYRGMIEDSLSWLQDKEKVWGLTLDKEEFIARLVESGTPA